MAETVTATRETKRYTFCGLRWKQTELTVAEVMRLRKISKVTLEQISKCQTFGDTLNVLADTGIIGDLFNMFLQREYSSTWEWIKHILMGWTRLIFRPKHVLPYLTLNETAGVLQDFFSLNTRFMQHFTNMASVLGSLSQTPETPAQ